MIETLKKIVLLVLLLACLSPPGVVRDAAAGVPDVQVTLSPYSGLVSWSGNLNLNRKLIYGARAGLGFGPLLGIEATYGWTPSETKWGPELYPQPIPPQAVGADVMLFGMDVVFTPTAGLISPYLLAGASRLRYKSDDPVPGSSSFNGMEGAGGFKVRVSNRIAARMEARDFLFKHPNTGTNHNFIFSAGLQFAFGGGGAGPIADADRDGVSDRLDQCPDTPPGVLVDAHGCPIDADGDGVPDGIDQCANTPAGAQVDARGCPMDTDNDGVLDGLDRCPDTPIGTPVDQNGCSAQGANPGTAPDQAAAGTPPPVTPPPAAPPPNQTVANDTPDAGTPEAAPDAKTPGRESELLGTGRITVREVRFETGKSVIAPQSFPVLDEIGRILVQWPELKVEIGGHTDSRGPDEYNVGLSQRRAEAVLNYMLEHFPQISRAQYSAHGYGASQPLASNDTPNGRSQNRRVEFKVLNTEVLAREKHKGQ